MNENELRRALAGHAAAIQPTGDVDRLMAGMARTDRVRTVRAMGAGCVAAVVVTFGVINFTGGEATAPVDVVDQPSPTLPTPTDPPPLLEDASIETSATSSTTTPVPATAGAPAHLADEAPVTSTTEAVVTTTAPPSTTAPTTTNPPATTTSTAPTTTTIPVFTASARYGTCAEDPPYDEYSGTSAPGATITVSSPHSVFAAVESDLLGNWWIRVEFPTAPLGEHFTVTVSDGTSSQDFDFVHTT